MTRGLLLLTVLGLAGCASIGPGTVTRDRFDYTAAVDVLERRVGPTHEDEVGSEGLIPPLIRIGNSVERPGDTFAAVRYRGHWFAIDDRDMPSQRLFTFLMFIFTLVETTSKEGAPVATIPAQ